MHGGLGARTARRQGEAWMCAMVPPKAFGKQRQVSVHGTAALTACRCLDVMYSGPYDHHQLDAALVIRDDALMHSECHMTCVRPCAPACAHRRGHVMCACPGVCVCVCVCVCVTETGLC
jgi:hypothetical protein